MNYADTLAKACDYCAKPDNGAGGNLHIVLDDGNTDIDSVQSCYDWSKEKGDFDGMALASNLMELTQAERDRLYSELNGHGAEDDV